MIETDKPKFKTLLESMGTLYDKMIDKTILQMYWKMLESYDFAKVTGAFEAHVRKSPFFPKPSDVLGFLEKKRTQHIGADEAWTIALRSMDESETVVMTDEIMQARAIAWDVWNEGDKVAARMAFKGAYERLVAENNPPKWRLVLGHDPARREEAIVRAVSQGLLPKTELAKYAYLGVDKNPMSLTQLAITSATKTEAMILDGNDKILAELQEMREQLAGKNAEKDKRAAEMVERLRKRKLAADSASKIIVEMVN